MGAHRGSLIPFFWGEGLSEEGKKSVEWWFEFKERVDNWNKSRDRIYEDKREAAFQFAIEVLDAGATKAREFINRPNIKWDIIKSYTQHGKLVKCKVCGNEDYSGYWCSPCIHHDWCCECCILLGIPYYGGGMYVMGKRKCQYCGHEFTDMVNLGSSINLGLGAQLTQTDTEKKTTCPKCGKLQP